MQPLNIPAIHVFVISEEFDHVIQRKWVEKQVKTTKTYQDDHFCVLDVRRKDSEIIDINLAQVAISVISQYVLMQPLSFTQT